MFLLSALGIFSFLEIKDIIHDNSKKIIEKSHDSIQKITHSAISDSIKELDKKSQDMIENQTLSIANSVADFLKKRDKDILYLANQKINQKSLENFYNRKNSAIHIPVNYQYNDKIDKWIPLNTPILRQNKEVAKLQDNAKEFHKINIKPARKKLIPIYKEITYYNLQGQEIYKVSSLDKKLKNISLKQNTYCRAEEYYQKSLKLKKNEIYVSQVIGEYIPSPIIGSFTKAKAQLANIKFEPKKYAYAGIENPVGKKFDGIIRFVTPVYKKNKLQGYLTFALDHQHIMDFTDFVEPISAASLDISDASKGNYAFMWSSEFKSISHPRDYFIVGYNRQTGEIVPGWIDEELASAFKKSGKKNLNLFLKEQPLFLNQSLKKKPNTAQIKKGQIALDCRYLNFAPQCQGWSQLTEDGGYGSFIIFWSNVWKLTTAATIPYYTGQYKNSKRGFGFITIGANTEEFHKAATKTKEKIDKDLAKEENSIEENILQITKHIFQNIKSHTNNMILITIILIILVIYVAIYIANHISNKINSVTIGIEKIKERDFEYQIETKGKDEIGKLKNAFNEMAQSINFLNKDLQNKLYTDELTKLKNRMSFWKDINNYSNPTLYLLDIDLFKNINDYYGVKAGNFVLVEFAHLLRKFAQDKQMNIYRIGSDEYLLLGKKSTYKVIKNTIETLSQLVSNTHFINHDLHVDITISFTCGISAGEGNLLEKADLALNEAVRKKVSYLIYSDSNQNMNKHKNHMFWKEKIQYAISNDMIIPFFQEIIDIKNPKNKKYEALIRIKDEVENKIISPYFFLDIAKEAKLYPQLTQIMVEKTFKFFEHKDVFFSLNLSIDDIRNKKTVNFIYKKIHQYNVQNKLIFELLETEEIGDFEEVKPFIKLMKRLGVKFAIDDFGSGYSNFSYLLQIKPDYIKIDGSLIKNLTLNSNEYHIVDAIVKFAKTLDAKVIAEHVSSKNIITALSNFDIDYLQGFYFSEPSNKLT
ncbi:GGDEF domain-containing protein [Sulfurospirillum arcachonense]|uniref:GGDEF domain-containing protein n=1 Tax=Sulfurospirillum arcachonense TaxID=57666 RepID=UPI00146FB2F7|nr:GGDEF domain-containing protein [Sulfurospirillum arcachonense]